MEMVTNFINQQTDFRYLCDLYELELIEELCIFKEKIEIYKERVYNKVNELDRITI